MHFASTVEIIRVTFLQRNDTPTDRNCIPNLCCTAQCNIQHVSIYTRVKPMLWFDVLHALAAVRGKINSRTAELLHWRGKKYEIFSGKPQKLGLQICSEVKRRDGRSLSSYSGAWRDWTILRARPKFKGRSEVGFARPTLGIQDFSLDIASWNWVFTNSACWIFWWD